MTEDEEDGRSSVTSQPHAIVEFTFYNDSVCYYYHSARVREDALIVLCISSFSRTKWPYFSILDWS